MNKKFSFAAFVFGLAVLPLFSQTSADNPRLKKALESYPEADLNKDGILTMDEGKAFKKNEGQSKPGEVPSADKPAPKSSENDPELEKLLVQYPRADTNEDNILTAEEADAFRAKKSSGGAGGGRKGLAGITPTVENINYGANERHVFDLWKIPETANQPAPLLICIHGGAFVGGDKADKYRSDPLVAKCLQAGISVASINYRLVGTDPFPAPFLDGMRMIQFIRAHAEEYGIDPKRIGLTGSSAGANMSLWIALQDDRADPNSDDPVSRESTRVSFVIGNQAQTSNDPEFIRAHIYNGSSPHTSTLSALGIIDPAEVTSERVKALAYECSAINFVSEDDPPIMLNYKGPLSPTPRPDGTPQGEWVHHPKWGVMLKEKYEKIGVGCELYYAGQPMPMDADIKFIERIFFGTE